MEYENLILENRYTILNEIKYSILDKWYISLVLSFNMETQTQSNWCWAATSTSVSKFYSFLSPWTQCKVASLELEKKCCDSPLPSGCNVSWYLDKALTRTHNFVKMQSGTITWQEVKDELNKGLVVGTRIGWSGGGGHFMVIYGVSRSLTAHYLHIDDPIYGKSVLTYDQYATNYQGSGTWTHTYFTKKHFYFMWFKEYILNSKLLEPIPEIKPLLHLYDRNIIPEEQMREDSFSIPHETYLIELKSIKRGFKLPTSPNSLRIIDVKNKKPSALFEVGLDVNRPKLIQMNVSSIYFSQLDGSLGRLKRFSEKNKDLGEIRFIKVPALNIEAFWLHYGSKTEDIITPLRRFENDDSFDWNKGYTIKEFTKLLEAIGAKFDKKDDTIGA